MAPPRGSQSASERSGGRTMFMRRRRPLARAAMVGGAAYYAGRKVDEGVVRLIDLLFVKKPEGGELEVIQRSDLSEDEAMDFGAMVGALAGLGAGGEEETLSAAIAGAEESEDGHFFGDAEVWYLSDA